MRLRFALREVIDEHAVIVDRVDWILPKKRLEEFRRSGIVINELQRTTIDGRARVGAVAGNEATLTARSHIVTVDVPRHSTGERTDTGRRRVTIYNAPAGPSAEPLDVVEAASADFPKRPLRLGDTWRTLERVSTTLGSGMAKFTHRVTAVNRDEIAFTVSGRGTITGAEYHLPKLLPGSIELQGTARFEREGGFVSYEHYELHNRLIKPLGAEQHGFEERETVDISTTVTGPGK